MATLLAMLLSMALAGDGDVGVVGDEPEPIVLILEDRSIRREYPPLEDVLFGETGDRRWDFELLADGGELVRRPIEGETAGGPRIPLVLDPAAGAGEPGVVLEIERPEDRPVIAKGQPFALSLRATDPARLRSTFGPGVYEGAVWLKLIPRDAGVLGDIRHRLRTRLLIPGRRAAEVAIEGETAVGRRARITAAVEEVATTAEAAETTTSLRVELTPEGGETALFQAPWPVPEGAWDPRKVAAADGWAVPADWLDEPILADQPATRSEVLVDKGPARSIVHRQSLLLPPLFAPGSLKARLTGLGDSAGAPAAEAMVQSGILAGPSLAFLNDRLGLRALVSRGVEGVAAFPDKEVKVRVDPPTGPPQVFTLRSDGKTTGFATFSLAVKEQPRLLRVGTYKITPATGDPGLDRALGGETSILVGLEKDDQNLGRERVAFLGSIPFHWPLLVWLDSGRKDGERHRAVTRRALAVRTVRGPEEIHDLSLAFSKLIVPPRSPAPDEARDGRLRFRTADPKAGERAAWPLGRDWLELDLEVDLDKAIARTPPPKGERVRYARFLIQGVGPNQEPIGRIFYEPASYSIAAPWDYYWEWAWLVGPPFGAVAIVWLLRPRASKGASGSSKPKAAPARREPSGSGGRFDEVPDEPAPPVERPAEPGASPPGEDDPWGSESPSPPRPGRFD